MPNKKGKKLTIDDRAVIYVGLKHRRPFAQIAREIGVAPSTISREIRVNRVHENPRQIRNFCAHKGRCVKEGLCQNQSCIQKCCRCKKKSCNALCLDFEEMECHLLKKPPYVCNSCSKRYSCGLRRYYYRVSSADKKALKRRSDSRAGIDVDPAVAEPVIAEVVARLSRGQAPAHIWNHMGDTIPFSERSFYRHIAKGCYGLSALNLPRKVRYKPRYHAPKTYFRPSLEGRTYADWLALSEQERMQTVQIDCLKGTRAEKAAVLSLHFPLWRFQLYLKLEVEDARHVAKAFDALELYCQGEFSTHFGILLADRGSGFPVLNLLEKGLSGQKRCTIYFCDTRRPEQKGACEKNHVEFRRVVPKGVALTPLDSCDLSLAMSHINSYTRKSLGGRSPYDLASQHLPASLLEALGIKKIPPQDVVLKPYLLK